MRSFADLDRTLGRVPAAVVSTLRSIDIGSGTRDEQQLAGYRTALDHLLQDDWRPLTPGLVLHVHRLLWSHTATPGGRLKTSDDLVVDRARDGSVTVRLRPVPADRTEFFLSELVDRYAVARAAVEHHPVLLVGLFALSPMRTGCSRSARRRRRW